MWLARDLDGTLNLFIYKPIQCKRDGYFTEDYRLRGPEIQSMELDSRMFPHIKFKNSPVKCKLTEIE